MAMAAAAEAERFNSTLVLLEDPGLSPPWDRLSAFQFHAGSIRRKKGGCNGETR